MTEATVDSALEQLLAAKQFEQATVVAIQTLGPQVLGYLTAILGDHERARDVFSVFSEDLWSGLPGYRGDGSFRAWVYRIARNAALRTVRDPYWRRGRRLATEEHSALAAAVRSTTKAHARPSADAKLARLRSALTPDEHALLILRVDRDLSWSEIASALTTGKRKPDEAALRKRFERLKAKLRRLAEAEGMLR
ncbi:MAG TPA: sigma-70 family RNA polymerase sigma factor [Kofleriaceae bacterium]|nr:sigma-70 family RNA polymerase sigma factor [Kofleriaceae bacterium]